MTLAANIRRRLKPAVAGMLVAAGLLAVPATSAHAVNIGVLFGNPQDVFNGPGRTCGDQSAPGVYIYSDNTYRGKCGYWEFERAYYDESTIRTVVGNDKASSMRIVGGGGSRFVRLYKHNGYRVPVANNVVFTGDVPDFKAYRFEDGSSLNDNLSSLYIS
jgi:hypothetical protein